MTCSQVTPTGGAPAFTMCSGEIASFDGIGIDTDLSFPTGATTPLPTILMLHGWGGDKTEWEAASPAGDGADSWHWNNVWFAEHRWVAVTTTARGFMQSCGLTDQDANCTDGYTHLAQRGFETKDSQTVLGQAGRRGDRRRLDGWRRQAARTAAASRGCSRPRSPGIPRRGGRCSSRPRFRSSRGPTCSTRCW